MKNAESRHFFLFACMCLRGVYLWDALRKKKKSIFWYFLIKSVGLNNDFVRKLKHGIIETVARVGVKYF